jgi:dienelactone hydrolase
MKHIAFAALFVTLLALLHAGAARAERTAYTLYRGDDVLGTETLSMKEQDGQLIVKGKMEVDGAGMTFKADLLSIYDSTTLAWISFSNIFEGTLPQGEQKGRIDATQADGEATVNVDANGMKIDNSFKSEDVTYLLDLNQLHHYAMFFRRIAAEGWFENPEERTIAVLVPSNVSKMDVKLGGEVTAGTALLNDELVGTYSFDFFIQGIPTTMTIRDDTYQLLHSTSSAVNTSAVLEGFQFAETEESDWYAPFSDDVVAETGSFESNGLAIGYELTLPKGDADKLTGIVIVHGSGPVDRDGTLGPNTPYRDLAYLLARRGAAVLRYDKRTHVDPLSVPAEQLSMETVVMADARVAAATLRAHARVDDEKIAIAGHSLGGRAAPSIARDVEASHVIILAGSALSLLDTLERQMHFLAGTKGLDEESVKRERQAATAMIAPLRDRTSAADTRVLGAPAHYWWDIEDLDPIPVLESFEGKALVIRGDRDYQIVAEDTARWQVAIDARNREGDVVYEAPGVNHALIRSRGDIDAGDVYKPGHVDELVVNRIVSFLELEGKKKKKKRRRR